ncbi:MAG: hypothetical protein JWO64_1118 [Hyphomicrobiales bacterium]|nr:hypothetical protein [Hyphomicrobiales bacterium]
MMTSLLKMSDGFSICAFFVVAQIVDAVLPSHPNFSIS